MKTDIKQSRESKNRQADDQEPCKRLTLSPPVFLHNDIFTGIFPRLPLRSLIRSKCVSKEWQSLISHQHFTPPCNFNPPSGVFLQRISTDVTAVSTRAEYDFVPFVSIKTPPFRTLDFHENVLNPDVMILHSSNGLMLCYSLHVSKEGEFNATYYVYNPTTKQVATLPTCQDFDIQRPSGATLIFDPLKSSHYRVVFVRGYNNSNDIYSIEIYSSETRTWKIFYLTVDDMIETEFMSGVYWNSSIHWINKKGHILFVRIDGEATIHEIGFRRPVLIDQQNIKRYCCPLVESRDRLMLMGISSIVNMWFDVREVDKDYSRCPLKYRINLNQVTDGFSDPMQSFVIHCLVLGEKEEDAFIVLEVPGKAIKLNIVSDTLQELCDLDSQRFKFSVADDGFSKVGRRPGAFLFFESLAHL